MEQDFAENNTYLGDQSLICQGLCCREQREYVPGEASSLLMYCNARKISHQKFKLLEKERIIASKSDEMKKWVQRYVEMEQQKEQKKC